MEPSGPKPRLLVAVDPNSSAGQASPPLVVLDREEVGWQQSSVRDLPAAEDLNISLEELQNMLYTTEGLRKLADFD